MFSCMRVQSLVVGMLAIALLAVSTLVNAQGEVPTVKEGGLSIRGQVIAAHDKSAVVDARVIVVGGQQETTTNDKGVFHFSNLGQGTLKVKVSSPGYFSKAMDVDVQPGSNRPIFMLVQEAEDDVQVIDVEGQLLDASEAKQVIERRFSAGVNDRIGQEEIKKAAAGDAGEVAANLPGVSIVGGRFAYVRGLGERYSQTLLNQFSIPSPEPSKRVVPLDLFPSNLIESLVIAKTYSPDLPGEFAGGSVQIQTVDVPQYSFFKIGVGLGYADGTSGQGFRTYEGGKLDSLTFEDGTRELPSAVPSQLVRSGMMGFSDDQLQVIGRSFNNIWESHEQTAPLDHKVSMSFGSNLEVADGALGIIGAVNWANKYRRVEDETFRVLLADPDPLIFNDYKLDTSTFESELSALLNLTYEISPAQKIGLRNILTRGVSDRVKLQSGHDGQLDGNTEVAQLRYVERMLHSTQLFGEHLLVGDLLLDWRVSRSTTNRDEPDNRQVRYDFNEPTGDFRFREISSSGRRSFYLLDEDVTDLGLDLSIPFNPFDIELPDTDPNRIDPIQKIKIGAAYTDRDRSFEGRSFRFTTDSSVFTPVDVNGVPIDFTGSPEDLFNFDDINPDGFTIFEQTRETDTYDATQELLAMYAMADFRLHPDFRVQAGVRMEKSEQEVKSFVLFTSPPEPTTASLEESDYMPSVNLTWEFYKDMQLRLGGSQTVSRPEFRELAEFEYTDTEGGFSAIGNPNLDRAKIQNFDARWEWFPQAGELYAVSLFYKSFDAPIEQVIRPTGSSLITSWENSDEGHIQGLEFELRKAIGAGFTLKSNMAFISSEVEARPDQVGLQTNNKRELQGQPSYTFNTGIFHEAPSIGLSSGLILSSFGERLSRVGTNGVDDEVEKERWDLRFVIGKKVGNGSIKISAKNLLDSKYEYEQGGVVTRSYKKGLTVSFSYSIEF